MRLLTSKCASRLGGVPIFEVASSKTAQGMRCFATFDFQMCFAPRRHANFPSCISKTAPSMRCFAKCASRLGGVPIFVSPSVKGLRARRFSQPTVRAIQTHHPLKNASFRDFPSISRAQIFFLLTAVIFCHLTLCSLTVRIGLVASFYKSEVRLLNFLRKGVLTSQWWGCGSALWLPLCCRCSCLSPFMFVSLLSLSPLRTKIIFPK